MAPPPSGQSATLADQVNTVTDAELRSFLTACCDAPDWVDAVAAGRPYADTSTLLDEADRAARGFSAADVDRAIAAHPRIGESATGDSPEARWSRREQASVDGDDVTMARLATANRRYEERFGRVLLICAAGLSAEEILATAEERLEHTAEKERAVVADELRKIAMVRLQRGVDQ